MSKYNSGKNLFSLSLVWVMLMAPLVAVAQTRINMPKNKYDVREDVEIGNRYSAKVEQELPILRDLEATRYLENVGRRLVKAIPKEFQQPAFRYRFKIIDASDINAFALPGGSMYVNRGLIQVAKNEGEMAGVMAHEISHIALRHGTAQATKQKNPLNQVLGIGAVVLGGVLLGQTGAQLAKIGVASYYLKFSREFESQSDILGARIMAHAGYDPMDLANMFRTINQQSKGGRLPDFLNSHPNPGRRYERISNEAGFLKVSSNPIKYTRGFSRIKEKFQSLPRAKSMAKPKKEKESKRGRKTKRNNARNSAGDIAEMDNGRYSRNVQTPSTRTVNHYLGNVLRIRTPRNWRKFVGKDNVWFAPAGAYGIDGITHGIIVGLLKPQEKILKSATQSYVRRVLKSNAYLRQKTRLYKIKIRGRNAYRTLLSGRSPVTGSIEYAYIYTTQIRNKDMLYITTVAPSTDRRIYDRAFDNIIRSIRLYR